MNIVLCYPLENRHLQQVQQQIPDASVIPAGQEKIADAIHDADIYCGHAKVPVDWDAVVRRGRLQWIQSSAAGIDHCLVPPVIDSPIMVTSASGLFAPQVAEQTMALLLGLLRSIPRFVRAQQAREFVRRPTQDLAGKTVGIVGFGGNGRRLASVLAPFEVRLLATDVFPESRPAYVESLWPAAELSRLLAESDVVIITVPLLASTIKLFDAETLGQMKPGALLVNVARGPVVDERALVEALQQGQLGGAALDVTEVEPLPQQSELWDLPNVLITPHVGAQSARRLDLTTRFFCENLKRFVNGETLLNLVDKQLGFPRPANRVSASATRIVHDQENDVDPR